MSIRDRPPNDRPCNSFISKTAHVVYKKVDSDLIPVSNQWLKYNIKVFAVLFFTIKFLVIKGPSFLFMIFEKWSFCSLQFVGTEMGRAKLRSSLVLRKCSLIHCPIYKPSYMLVSVCRQGKFPGEYTSFSRYH